MSAFVALPACTDLCHTAYAVGVSRDTLPVGDASAAGKSFSLTKDSNGSSLSALGAGGFGDGDFMDGVSLDDIGEARGRWITDESRVILLSLSGMSTEAGCSLFDGPRNFEC